VIRTSKLFKIGIRDLVKKKKVKKKREEENWSQVNWLNQGCLASGEVSNISRYVSAESRPRLSVSCQWLAGAGAPLKTESPRQCSKGKLYPVLAVYPFYRRASKMRQRVRERERERERGKKAEDEREKERENKREREG